MLRISLAGKRREMGYDPYFVDERVALAGSEEFLNVHEDNNYE